MADGASSNFRFRKARTIELQAEVRWASAGIAAHLPCNPWRRPVIVYVIAVRYYGYAQYDRRTRSIAPRGQRFRTGSARVVQDSGSGAKTV